MPYGQQIWLEEPQFFALDFMRFVFVVAMKKTEVESIAIVTVYYVTYIITNA